MMEDIVLDLKMRIIQMEDMRIETKRMKAKKGSPERCLREMTMGLKLNITMIGSWRTWAERIRNIRFPGCMVFMLPNILNILM